MTVNHTATLQQPPKCSEKSPPRWVSLFSPQKTPSKQRTMSPVSPAVSPKKVTANKPSTWLRHSTLRCCWCYHCTGDASGPMATLSDVAFATFESLGKHIQNGLWAIHGHERTRRKRKPQKDRKVEIFTHFRVDLPLPSGYLTVRHGKSTHF